MKKTVTFLTNIEFSEISLVDKPANDLATINHVSLAKNDKSMATAPERTITNAGVSTPVVKGEMRMTDYYRSTNTAMLEGRNMLVRKQKQSGADDIEFARNLAENVSTSLYAALKAMTLDDMRRLTTRALSSHEQLTAALDNLEPLRVYASPNAQENLSANDALDAAAPKMSMGTGLAGDINFFKSIRNQLRRPHPMSEQR